MGASSMLTLHKLKIRLSFIFTLIRIVIVVLISIHEHYPTTSIVKGATFSHSARFPCPVAKMEYDPETRRSIFAVQIAYSGQQLIDTHSTV